MNEMRAVKDLAIGDVIQVEGFDTNLTVRSAKKVKKGLDAGKLQVTLATADGETEVMGFDPEERVKVVGKDADGGKGQSGGKGRAAGGKGKGKAKAKAAPDPAAPEAAVPGRATGKKAAGQKKPAGEKKLSAIDAAAKVLADTGTAMNCQELIKVMAEKGLWTSPGGKTPASTLYTVVTMLPKGAPRGDISKRARGDPMSARVRTLTSGSPLSPSRESGTCSKAR
jgi:hypothetical protein